ncbi:MAG TPA: methylated-DNA--[protein]-cysteine S-methyltransferase [Roseiflexaceae bacterium]|nr:methylated-DNA--[protein]-cysteine S-methyltransferase [Roseiflexaceae bacterium]
MRQETLRRLLWQSPLGPIDLWATEGGLVRLGFPATEAAAQCWAERWFGVPPQPATPDDGLLSEAVRQLDEYLRGARRVFDLPLALCGTPFQQEVWRALLGIPWGATLTYRELAARVGRPAAVRAVGAANGANPLSIVVPCHRVIASDGALRGYSGGLDLKRTLLALEASAG